MKNYQTKEIGINKSNTMMQMEVMIDDHDNVWRQTFNHGLKSWWIHQALKTEKKKTYRKIGRLGIQTIQSTTSDPD